MTSGQKTAFSLLTALILFVGFVFVANNKLNLFENLEKQYYSQARVSEKISQLNKVSQSVDDYITNVLNIVQNNDDAFLKSSEVLSYLDVLPSEKQIEERRIKTIKLLDDLPELDGIRIIEDKTRLIHYSTFEDKDLVSKDRTRKTYDRYTTVVDEKGEIPYEDLVPNGNLKDVRLLLDGNGKRLIFVFPIKVEENLASLFCYFNFVDIQKKFSLLDEIYGETIAFVCAADYSGGIVLGIPAKTANEFTMPLLDAWKNPAKKEISEKINAPQKLLKIDDERYWEMLESSSAKYLKICGVYSSDIFELSEELRILIYVIIGLSIFIIVFLCFSFAGDKEAVLKKRIKKIQYEVIKEYLNNKEKIQWNAVVDQVRMRKSDLSEDILKALHVSKKKSKELDSILEKSWEEIFAVIETKVEETQVPQNSIGVSKEELRVMLEEVLKETKLNVNVSKLVTSGVQPLPEKQQKVVDEVEEIEEIDEIEEVDEVEEVEEIDEVEEIAEVDEVEEIAEADEVEEVDEVEEIEEIAEADEVEEIEEVAEVDEVEEIDEIEEVEEVDEVEEIEEIDEVEEIAEVDEVEEIAEADELEEIEEIDEVEEIAEADELEEIEDVNEIDPIALAQAFSPIDYQYNDSNDSFIEKGLFPTVENLFADRLCLGGSFILKNPASIGSVKFKVYRLDEESEVTPLEEVSELEDITNDMFYSNDYFAMTKFGANTNNIVELDGINANSIVENDGVYSISEDLVFTDVIQDSAFKELVDSVLR